jgi:hypothetical protein
MSAQLLDFFGFTLAADGVVYVSKPEKENSRRPSVLVYETKIEPTDDIIMGIIIGAQASFLARKIVGCRIPPHILKSMVS